MNEMRNHRCIVMERGDDYDVATVIDHLRIALASVPEEHRPSARVFIDGGDEFEGSLSVFWETPKTPAEIMAEIEPSIARTKERISSYAEGRPVPPWLLSTLAEYEGRYAAAAADLQEQETNNDHV